MSWASLHGKKHVDIGAVERGEHKYNPVLEASFIDRNKFFWGEWQLSFVIVIQYMYVQKEWTR